MKERILFRALCVAIILGALPVISCRQAAPTQTAGSGAPATSVDSGLLKSVEEMTSECRKHCQKTSASAEETRTLIQEVRQSKDPAKTTAALAKMESNLDDVKGHLAGCLSMMEISSGRLMNKAR